MKTRMFLGIIAIIGFIAIGCPVDRDDVEKPTASPEAGTYSGLDSTTTSVTLSCSTAGASIYYTLDGSAPTTGSTLYSGAIVISQTTTLKAIATKNGLDNSEVLTATYTIFNGRVLKVTGIPENQTIMGAALIDLQTMATEGVNTMPSVVGMHNPRGFFSLYSVGSNPPMPDITKPWSDTNEYVVALSTAMDANGDQFLYTNGKDFLELQTALITQALTQDSSYLSTLQNQDQAAQEAISELLGGALETLGISAFANITPYDFTEPTTTIAWDKFKKRPSDSEVNAFTSRTEIVYALMELVRQAITDFATQQGQQP